MQTTTSLPRTASPLGSRPLGGPYRDLVSSPALLTAEDEKRYRVEPAPFSEGPEECTYEEPSLGAPSSIHPDVQYRQPMSSVAVENYQNTIASATPRYADRMLSKGLTIGWFRGTREGAQNTITDRCEYQSWRGSPEAEWTLREQEQEQPRRALDGGERCRAGGKRGWMAPDVGPGNTTELMEGRAAVEMVQAPCHIPMERSEAPKRWVTLTSLQDITAASRIPMAFGSLDDIRQCCASGTLTLDLKN